MAGCRGSQKKTTTIKTPTIYQPCDAQSTLAKKKNRAVISEFIFFFFQKTTDVFMKHDSGKPGCKCLTQSSCCGQKCNISTDRNIYTQ